MVLGLLLLMAEALIPADFFVFFLGVGSIVTSLTTALGLTSSAMSQGMVFVLVSAFSVVFLRNRIRERMQRSTPDSEVDALVGQEAITQTEIAAGDIGKAELRGTAWNAKNEGAETIPANKRCRVERVDGLTLILKQ
jgi:hypothetical protein